MKVLLSPAKSLNTDRPANPFSSSLPLFLEDSEKVNRKLKSLSKNKLMQLQSISRQLAEENYGRNQEWSVDDHSARGFQAALLFDGDVYSGLEAWNWSEEDMAFAQEQLLILSGLYGLLLPSDLILPYRLEMGTKLKVGRKENLYAFWEKQLKAYFKQLDESKVLVNLASQEYFKAVHHAKPKQRIVHLEFYDLHQGEYKVLSFFAKKARGTMARFIVERRLKEVDELKMFEGDGYYFHGAFSTNDTFVFHRDEKP